MILLEEEVIMDEEITIKLDSQTVRQARARVNKMGYTLEHVLVEFVSHLAKEQAQLPKPSTFLPSGDDLPTFLPETKNII